MNKIDPSIIEVDRINNYSSALNLVDGAWRSHHEYWTQIRKHQDHIRGKKPKDPRKLKEMGMGWVSNYNFGKARASHERGVAENVDKVKDAIFLCNPELSRKKKYELDEELSFLANPIDREVVSMAIGRVLYDTYEKDPRFNSWLNQIEYPSFSFGYSAVVQDPNDWMGTPVHTLEIAFEDKTKPEEINSFVVFDNIKALDFYDKWIKTRNLKISYEMEGHDGDTQGIYTNGWSLEALEEVLYYAFHDDEYKKDNRIHNWEQVIPHFSDNHDFFIRNTHNIKIAKIFYRNLNKSWSEIYIPYNNEFDFHREIQGFTSASTERSVDLILYKKDLGPVSQSRLINLITDSGFSESKYIHDLRGLAKFSVEDSIRYNRKRNSIEDKLTFAGQPMFSKPNTQAGESIKIGVSQGFTLVENGFTLLPTQPNFDLNSHIASINLDERGHLRDTVQYDAKLQGRTTSRPTKAEINSVSSEIQQAKISKNSVKFSNYSQLILSNLRWLCESIPPDEGDPSYDSYQYFFEELFYQLSGYFEDKKYSKPERRKIIKSILKEVAHVRIDAYMGSPESIQVALQLSETPFGRNKLKRILLLANGIPRREIGNMVPLNRVDDSSDKRMAIFENDMFLTSGEDTFMESDDHITHLTYHQERVKKLVEKVQSGAMGLKDAFSYLSNSLTHQERHLVALDNDPTLSGDRFKQVHEQNIRILEQVKTGLEADIRRSSQEQQEQVSKEDQEFAAEQERLALKARKKEERTDALTINRARQKELQHQQSLRLQRERAELEMELEEEDSRKKTDLEIAKSLANGLRNKE